MHYSTFIIKRYFIFNNFRLPTQPTLQYLDTPTIPLQDLPYTRPHNMAQLLSPLNEVIIAQESPSDLAQTILSLFETTQPQSIASTIIPHYPTLTAKLQSDSMTDKPRLVLILLDILLNGTTADLCRALSQPQNTTLFSLITPKLYSNLQLLTFTTFLEHLLLSPTHFDRIQTQVAFCRVPFSDIAHGMNTTHRGTELINLFKSHSDQNELLSALTQMPIITLLASSFSTQLVVGILHDVMGDFEGVLEVRQIDTRPLLTNLNTTTATATTTTTSTVVSIDDLLGGLDVLIDAVAKTAKVV